MSDHASPRMSNFSFDDIANFSDVSNASLNACLSDGTADKYLPYDQRPETYIVPVIFALIFIVGSLGNGTLIYIFIRNKSLRNVPNTYIINLSIGDLLVIAITVPFVSTIYTIESWPFGEVICKFSEFVRDTSIGVSVFTLTALSADRYFAIVNPMRKHIGRAGGTTIATVLAIWVMSILLAFPAAFFSFVATHNNNDGTFIAYCYPFPEYLGLNYPKINVMFKFIVFYAMPLVVISVFYTVMAHHLLLTSRHAIGEARSQQSKQIETRKKVAKMVFSFVVLFAICFLPNHVFALWFHFDPDAFLKFDDFWHALRVVGFCLSFINSCINPIALYCMSRVFRRHYNQYLFCCLVSQRSVRYQGGSTSTLVTNFSTMRRASTLAGVTNFEIEEDRSGNCHVFHKLCLIKSQDSVENDDD